MRKKWAVRLGVLLASGCPYVFWGMYADAAYRSMKGYLAGRQDPGHPGAADGKSGQLFVVLLVCGPLPVGEMELVF